MASCVPFAEVRSGGIAILTACGVSMQVDNGWKTSAKRPVSLIAWRVKWRCNGRYPLEISFFCVDHCQVRLPDMSFTVWFCSAGVLGAREPRVPWHEWKYGRARLPVVASDVVKNQHPDCRLVGDVPHLCMHVSLCVYICVPHYIWDVWLYVHIHIHTYIYILIIIDKWMNCWTCSDV